MKPHTCFSAALCVCVFQFVLAPQSRAVDAAFVHIRKSDASTETRLHISEVEAFSDSIVPDGLGGATFGALPTSTNDIGDGTLTTDGIGNIYPVLGTTDSIQHGAANANPDNLLQNAGDVWSTGAGLAYKPQYLLNLGGTHDVTKVRIWPRADGCCQERFRNLEVQLLDAAMNPISGTLTLGPTENSNAPLDLDFNPTTGTIDLITFEAEITYPDPDDTVVISSAANGTVVGTLTALNDGGLAIEGATFTLVAGTGDTDNASYSIGGPDGDQLLVNADLTGLDNVMHSVRLLVDGGIGTEEVVVPFTVKLDSEPDGLIDEWELVYGTLGEFATGADADSDNLNDEDEFTERTHPKEEDTDGDDSKDGDEIANGTDPNDDDTDDDGLNDGGEATAMSDPLVPDTDADGLLDGYEVAVDAGAGNEYMTDPTKADTDGDWFDDAFEIASGTDPTSAGSKPNVPSASGRFLEIVKNDLVDTRLHIAEIEVFAPGTVPDGVGGGPDGLSRNDLIDTRPLTAVPYLGVGTPTTTTQLEHGNNANSVNNTIEREGVVWSTAAGLADNARFVLDLGETVSLDVVRVWGRGDNCCLQRLENVTINLYADIGDGNPGDLISSVVFPDQAPHGDVGPLEVALGAGATIPTPLEITEIIYNRPAQEFTITWRSEPLVTYGIFYSYDLIDWGADVNDNIPGAEGVDTTSYTFPHPTPLDVDPEDIPEIFFRVEDLTPPSP